MSNNFAIIVATDEKWGIGKDGRIPWHYPDDFLWFRNITMGATCFMGRKTYEELAEIRFARSELLPGRRCVVVSSKPVDDERVVWCPDITKFYDYATEDNLFIGGRGIYEFGLTVADTVYVTAIPGDYDCDVQFPHEMLASSFSINNEVQLSGELKVDIYARK